MTFWGLTDGLSWRAEEQCLLFDDDLSRKPAFEGVVNAIGNTGNVMDSINSIGKVELTKECKAKIEAARSAYDALTDAQKALVPNEVLKLLEDAETEYQRLEESKIESVVDSINSIGKVELTKECKAKIEAARSAYDALTDAQKALVPSEALKLLEDAETEYQRLEEESETPPIPPIVEKIDIRQEYISAIPAQIYSGAALTPNVTVTYENKTLVKNVDYTVNYKNNTEIGTATIVITGTGDYSGTVEKNFTITVRKNQVYVVGNYKYKITNAKTDGKGKVMLTGVKNKAQKKKLKKINVAAAVEIGGKSFKVTAIGDAAFKGFTKATKIVVGKNVTTIGSSAFLGCTRAKSIVVGENVTTIGSSAFSGCTKVVSATVGNKVTKIGAKAFYKCKNLKKIVIKGSKLKSIGKNAIKGINKKAVIKCPKKMVKKYKKLWKTSTGYKKTMKINS